jgi:hypothetical protein
MGDERWIYGYDPETKKLFLQWKSPQSLTLRVKKSWQVWSSTKRMLIVFFDMKGIVHSEFISPNTMSMVSCDF